MTDIIYKKFPTWKIDIASDVEKTMQIKNK